MKTFLFHDVDRDSTAASWRRSANDSTEQESSLRRMGATREYRQAARLKLDAWVPANGGHETPINCRDFRRVLYCFNFAQRRHAYIDLATDTEMTQDEVNAAGLGGF